MMHCITYSSEGVLFRTSPEGGKTWCSVKINAREYFFVSHLKEDGWATSGWLTKDGYCS
jgi:hypothetical protein